MFRNILVGCDDSDGTFDALALAHQLRDPEDGRLILASGIGGDSAPAARRTTDARARRRWFND